MVQPEGDRLATLHGAVEYGAIGQLAGVVHLDFVGRFGLRCAVHRLEHLILEPAGGGLDTLFLLVFFEIRRALALAVIGQEAAQFLERCLHLFVGHQSGFAFDYGAKGFGEFLRVDLDPVLAQVVSDRRPEGGARPIH